MAAVSAKGSYCLDMPPGLRKPNETSRPKDAEPTAGEPMADYAVQRRTMVDNQIRTMDVQDHAVIDAFDTVAREVFVPEAVKAFAYIDRPVDLGGGRALAQPGPLARILQLALPVAGEKVLVVGGATGYTAALMAEIGCKVVSLEENAGFAATARAALAGTDVEVAEGPLSAGWAAGAPYDLIFFDGAIEVLPEAFVAQVAEGGRIVAVEGSGLSAKAVVSVKASGKLSSRMGFNAPAPMLPGFARKVEFAL